jgi:hypothetical protein
MCSKEQGYYQSQQENPVFASCPFCGKTPDISDPDTLYGTGSYWVDDPAIGRVYVGRAHSLLAGNDPSGQVYNFNCVICSGGCGASVTGDSREEAIAAWNRRPEPNSGVLR